ncbi:MAG: PAS domain S-box protein [Spirochaetia bacterium]|jgi:PAS domain S-box-containing protein|nr:PAS domain S-box protein [Spirochaetia bacterium]
MDKQKTILLVEDDAIIALNQKMQLGKSGYTITHVNNGEKAVETVKEAESIIDLILMDIDLGSGIDGTQAASKILKLKEIPVVFLSSHTEPEIVEKTESITSYGYVVKNSGITVLDASIKMAFKLFNAHKEVLKHKIDADNANKDLTRLNRAIENTKDIVFITDTEGTIIYINSQFTNVYGYTKEEVIGKENAKIISAIDYTDEENHVFWENAKKKKHLQLIFKNKSKNGKSITSETSIDPIFDKNGKLIEFVQIHRDITEKLQVEENLRQSKEKHNELSNNANTMQSLLNNYEEAIWSVDKNFNYTSMNKYFIEDYKKAYGKEIKPGCNGLSLPQHEVFIWKQKYEAALKGDRISFEFNEDAQREKKYFRVNLNPIREKNIITGVAVIAVDITKQKLSELKIQNEISKSQQYLDIAGVMFVAINKDGNITLVNKKLCEISEYKEEELIGNNWIEIMIPERLKAEIIPVSKKLLNGEMEPVEYYENPILTKTGKEKLIAWHNTLLKDNNGNITGHLSSGEDITTRKSDEEKIKKLLKEKELILKEVHHRIKNNMTALISIIKLQTNTVKSEEAVNALLEIENRIRTMMVLYETLFQSVNFQSASANLYFPTLIESIVRNFPNSNIITVNKDIADFQLDAKTIFNTGIIINELITNSMKYAYKNRQSGELSISINLKDNNIIIIVEDNGIGLPQNFDIKTSSGFGMKLIQMLVIQMDGNIEIERKNGTKFIINIKLDQ